MCRWEVNPDVKVPWEGLAPNLSVWSGLLGLDPTYRRSHTTSFRDRRSRNPYCAPTTRVVAGQKAKAEIKGLTFWCLTPSKCQTECNVSGISPCGRNEKQLATKLRIKATVMRIPLFTSIDEGNQFASSRLVRLVGISEFFHQ
jgi:hypothetical protein